MKGRKKERVCQKEEHEVIKVWGKNVKVHSEPDQKSVPADSEPLLSVTCSHCARPAEERERQGINIYYAKKTQDMKV